LIALENDCIRILRKSVSGRNQMKKCLSGFLMIILLSGSCNQVVEEGGRKPQQTSERLLRGVSLSPRSFEGSDFSEFMERVRDSQDVLMWAGDWIELSKDGAPFTVSDLAGQYGYIPIIEVGHYNQGSGELSRPFDDKNRQIYLQSALDFVVKYQPAYFGMGVEINVLAQKNPGAFEEFVPFYNEVYDAIKAVSPGTKVFTVYQLEKIKGLTMWELDESAPDWEMIDLFDADIVAFTTYPGLFYRDVSDIPDDHYTEIKNHTSKPIAFTEIGWHSVASPAGWESSEAEQAEFIYKFFDLTRDLDLEVAVWSFMYDLEVFQPFDSMGLIDRDGNEKAGWEAWAK
jgi:hypothetical protein